MSAGDVEAINSVLSEHVAAVNAGDVSANMSGFAEDVVYLPPDGPPVRGKVALESFLRSAVDSFDAQIEMVPEETVVAGEWAFQWGTITGTLRPIGGGDSVSLDGKWMYVYQRQGDGSWKIARDVYNSSVPASSAN